MNKRKKSFLNAISALTSMVLSSLFGLVLSNAILTHFGSDYNGVNAAASQIVSSLTLLEGGFALASNVSLFEPWATGDYAAVNGILSATKIRFRLVGALFFSIGVLLALIYPAVVSSDLPFLTIFALILTVLIPAAFSLGFTEKYRIVLLVEQKEYVGSLLLAVIHTVGYILAILAIYAGASMLTARLLLMASLLIYYGSIILYCRKKYPYLSYQAPPAYEKIKGSGSVFVLKLSSVVYSSAPILMISILLDEGTILASIYAVYNSVLSVVRSGVIAIINAPRLSFGALLAEGRTEDAKNRFHQYELLTCVGLSVILGTTCLLILPFVDLFTSGVSDGNYHDIPLASIMLVMVFVELLRVPSSQIIQMGSHFTASRNIQLTSCIFLILLLLAGYRLEGLYGIVFAVMCVAMFQCAAEIWYAGARVLHRSWVILFKNAVPAITICLLSYYVGFSGQIVCPSYFHFIGYGFVSVAVLTFISCVCCYLLNKNIFQDLLRMVSSLFMKKS